MALMHYNLDISLFTLRYKSQTYCEKFVLVAGGAKGAKNWQEIEDKSTSFAALWLAGGRPVVGQDDWSSVVALYVVLWPESWSLHKVINWWDSFSFSVICMAGKRILNIRHVRQNPENLILILETKSSPTYSANKILSNFVWSFSSRKFIWLFADFALLSFWSVV